MIRPYEIVGYFLDCSLKPLPTGVEIVRVTQCLGSFATLLRKKALTQIFSPLSILLFSSLSFMSMDGRISDSLIYFKFS